MEKNNQFNLIVIGAGPGGYNAAVKAAQNGLSVAVVESASVGGVCLNWGCIPTKALLKSVQAMHYASSGADYGFTADNIKPDIDKIFSRSREVSATMSKGIDFLFKKNNVNVINGLAVLTADKQIDVTDDDGNSVVYSADNIIIATGSRPASLPFAQIDADKIWCYRQALMPPFFPRSMAIIGSGAIGTEFAFFYRSLGVEVTIIEFMDRVLPIEDNDVCAQVSRNLRKIGINVMTSSAVQSVEKGNLCKLVVKTKKGEEIIEAEVVLSAVGVIPNTDALGLEKLGVKTERGKIIVDANYQSSVAGVYAIGDVIATPALAHVASAEAEACVEAILGKEVHPINYGSIPGCTYISPEVASAGMREREAIEKGIDYKVSRYQFSANGKATAAGERDGFVKVISDAVSGKLLGVHMVGANVSEMIAGIVMALNAGLTLDQLAHSIFPHPTMSEAICDACK